MKEKNYLIMLAERLFIETETCMLDLITFSTHLLHLLTQMITSSGIQLGYLHVNTFISERGSFWQNIISFLHI